MLGAIGGARPSVAVVFYFIVEEASRSRFYNIHDLYVCKILWQQGVYSSQTQSPYPFTAMPMLAPSFGLYTTPTLLAWFDPSGPCIRGYVITHSQSAILYQGSVGSFTLAPNDYPNPYYWGNPTWNLAFTHDQTLYRTFCWLNGTLLVASPTVFEQNGSGTGIGELSMVQIGNNYGVSWTDNGAASGPVSSYSVRFKELYNGPITIWPDIWGSVSSPSLTY